MIGNQMLQRLFSLLLAVCSLTATLNTPVAFAAASTQNEFQTIADQIKVLAMINDVKVFDAMVCVDGKKYYISRNFETFSNKPSNRKYMLASITKFLSGLYYRDYFKRRGWSETMSIAPLMPIASQEKFRNVTFGHLLSNLSGIGNNAPFYQLESLQKTKEAIAQLELKSFNQFVYSNHGYALPGALIEMIEGRPYEDLFNEFYQQNFKSLVKISSNLETLFDKSDHDFWSPTGDRQDAGIDLRSSLPSGASVTNITNYANLLELYLSNWHTKLDPTPPSSLAKASNNYYAGLMKKNDGSYWHDGSLVGTSTQMQFWPDKKAYAIVFSRKDLESSFTPEVLELLRTLVTNKKATLPTWDGLDLTRLKLEPDTHKFKPGFYLSSDHGLTHSKVLFNTGSGQGYFSLAIRDQIRYLSPYKMAANKRLLIGSPKPYLLENDDSHFSFEGEGIYSYVGDTMPLNNLVTIPATAKTPLFKDSDSTFTVYFDHNKEGVSFKAQSAEKQKQSSNYWQFKFKDAMTIDDQKVWVFEDGQYLAYTPQKLTFNGQVFNFNPDNTIEVDGLRLSKVN
jgi:hypothetical protein